MAQRSTPWQRVPVLLRAVVTALAVLLLGVLPWGVLSQVNLKLSPELPWSVAVMALVLWVFWRYLDGAWAPRRTAEARRAHFRARACSTAVWAWALAAGLLGVLFTLAMLGVWERIVRLAPTPFPDLSRVPAVTACLVLVMTAVVAGIVEEAAFRGYLQHPLELRWGPVAAISITAVLFAAVHNLNGTHALLRFPFYLSLGLFLGAIAFISRSIVPPMVVHAAYDAQKLVRVWLHGFPDRRPQIRESGADFEFWASCALAVLLAAATIWALARLSKASRRAPLGQGESAPTS